MRQGADRDPVNAARRVVFHILKCDAAGCFCLDTAVHEVSLVSVTVEVEGDAIDGD